MRKNTWKIFINIGICNIINDYKITDKATDNRKVKTVKLFYKTVGDDLYFKGMVHYHNYIYNNCNWFPIYCLPWKWDK